MVNEQFTDERNAANGHYGQTLKRITLYLSSMKDKVIIQICMGSSCFSRGNARTLKTIQNYLKEHNLEGDVILKGNHCFENCSNGPVLKINDQLNENITQENILELLEKTFNQEV
ncbi:MAG: NAD(P)H-dependent oxidoreductase subunit E [Bacteroidales bacterium]|nr:NAD(P)H-dependent oxidoreductase subunit E [Bacteroidales bacterium]